MSTRRTIEYLDGQEIKYVLIHHSPAYTAQEVAASAHVPGKCMAKTIVVDVDEHMALAVVPANLKIDMDLLREAAHARHVQLSDPTEFANRFEGCQLGSMPPLGVLFGMETYVDRGLAHQEYIAFNAGSVTDVIAMRFSDFRRIAHPKLTDISGELTSGLGNLRVPQM